MRSGLTVVFIAALSLTACDTGRTDRMVSKDTTPLASGTMLLDEVTVGDVSGGSTIFNQHGISDSEFKDALQKSLAAKSMLAPEGTVAHYRIDAAMDFTYHAFNGMKVDGPVTYTIYDLKNNTKIFEQRIESDLSGNSDYIVPQVALFGTGAIGQTQRHSYEQAAANNLNAFIKTISVWTPPPPQ